MTNGLSIKENTFSILIHCVVCDAPARSLIKCTKLYSGYYGCDKCSQKGSYVEGKVTFPEFENLLIRTDASFRTQENKEHHHAVTPFCQLPIDLIMNFPIDYMHQSCLGIMKRLLNAWIKGPRVYRLSASQKDIISNRLIHIAPSIPSFFARKPRGLDDIEYWKATEFRQFLLYTGRIVLRGVLEHHIYTNFMHLSLAICILVSKRLNERLNDKAETLLIKFLTEASQIYGAGFMVYNVHQLAHLSAEAKEFGNLDVVSAFPFENYLQTLKKKIRSSRRPLVQIIKRIAEFESIHNRFAKNSQENCKRFTPQEAFILDNQTVCDVVSMSDDRAIAVECNVYSQTFPAYLHPMDSMQLCVYRVNSNKYKVKLIEKCKLKRPAIVFTIGNGDKEFVEVLHNE